MPVSKKRPSASRPQKRATVVVGASGRPELQVNLAGTLYTAVMPKKGKFMQMFDVDNMGKLMSLYDVDPQVASEAREYTSWMLTTLFGKATGEKILSRVDSDDAKELLDEDCLGEMLLGLAVEWTPDLADNTASLKKRIEPLGERMRTVLSDIRERSDSDAPVIDSE